MEKESSEIHPGFNKSKNPVKSRFNFAGIIENMKHSPSWEEGELNAVVLCKKPEKKVVLTALHKGTKIDSFQANDSITFQVIEGQLEFRAAKESVMLKKGNLLTLHEKIRYSLKSREETVYLLTIVTGEIQNTLSDYNAGKI